MRSARTVAQYKGTGACLSKWGLCENKQHVQSTAELGLCQQAADKGDVVAQCSLGIAYQDGNGVQQDSERAVALLLLAADQGHAETQYCLTANEAPNFSPRALEPMIFSFEGKSRWVPETR